MHRLKSLIPQEIRDSLNANPIFQWFVIVLVIVAGVHLVVKGIHGIRDRQVTGKRGHEFEGMAAQLLGVIYVVLGVFLAVAAIGKALGF